MIQRKKFNISLLGESMVGKTSIVKKLKNDDFSNEGLLTAGIDSYIDEAELDGKKYKFKIFDTAGQERFKSISKTTIKFSEGFMVIFSVIDRNSFEKVAEWIDNIKETVQIQTKSIYLIGNKIDAPNREVLNEEAFEYAKMNNLKYFETSAKTGHGIKEVFNQLYQDIYNLQKELGLDKDNLDLADRNNKKTSCC
jgi:small GTP-binding protein